MREYTESLKPKLSLAEQAASGHQVVKYFGDLDKFIGHDQSKLINLTMAQAAQAEWAAFEHILRMALTPKLEAA
jgi:hypothetical protein